MFLVLSLWTLIFSCEQIKQKDGKTTKDGNISTTISTDTSRLSKLIDITKYKPTKAKYKYVYTDNSGKDQRLSVPGPSDNYLEAILYFDNHTYSKLIAENTKLSTISNGRKESYQFEWLESNIKIELSKMNNFSDFPPTFFNKSSLMNGGYFMLNNKILLKLYTN